MMAWLKILSNWLGRVPVKLSRFLLTLKDLCPYTSSTQKRPYQKAKGKTLIHLKDPGTRLFDTAREEKSPEA